MKVANFLDSRPYAYHLTANQNVTGICLAKMLFSATALATSAHEKEILKARRLSSVEFERAEIRDQKPLHKGSIEFAQGFCFKQLLALINSLVYFWPGNLGGPIANGQRHFNKYRAESPAVLRIPTVDLLDANEDEPLVSRFNSGSPRCNQGRKSPRGPETFRLMPNFSEPPSKVVELVFRGTVRLPMSTEVGESPTGPWWPLFT